MLPIQPDKIEMPFAYYGGKNEIPATVDENSGNASLQLGFPPETQIPIAQGGIPSKRRDFNGILYTLSSYAHYAQSGGLFSWDETLDYVKNCMITHNNNIYLCVEENGASTSAGIVTPGTNENYWIELHKYLQQQAGGGNVGSGTNPVYANNGSYIASSSTVGSGTRPIYLSNGTITRSSSTVGSSTKPVYLKSGTFTACSSSGSLDVSSSNFSSGTGYVKFTNGLIIQWGTRATTGTGSTTSAKYKISFPISFSSSSSYVIVKNTVGGGLSDTTSSSGYRESDCRLSFWDKTAKSAYTLVSYKYINQTSLSSREEWLAIGY